MYVYLEGAWHPIADNEHTECGLLIPQATDWTRDVPEKVHCGPDATVEPAEPKAKAKK